MFTYRDYTYGSFKHILISLTSFMSTLYSTSFLTES
jgi:hypothetical protein